ncbi:MAG: DUF6029 family protein [Candidatus Latescibacterota bacterium]
MTFDSLSAAELPSPSFSNYLRYGSGKGEYYGFSRDKTYIEEEAELKLSWKDTIAGIRYDYDNPAEFTPDRNTIKKYYLDYRKSGWNLRAGTFSDLFGRGMAFRTYEEKSVGHDSEVSGLRATWLTDDTAVHVVGGRLGYEEIPDFTQTIDIDLAGVHLQQRVNGNFFLGGSFVQSEVTQQSGFFKDAFPMSVAEFTGEYRGEILKVFTSVASNENDGAELMKRNISSYLGANLFRGPLSLTLEYKNYRFGMAPPDVVSQGYRHRRLLPFQNPPSGLREHGWVFLSRRSTGIDFNDEVGFLADVYYSATPGTTLNLSGSLASRHHRYERIPDAGFNRVKDGPSWLPSVRKEYSPYWQVYGDIEHFFENGSSVTAGAGYTYENNYNSFYPELEEVQRMATVPLHTQIILSSLYSLQCSAEYQYFQEALYSRTWYSNGILSLGIARSPWLNFSVTAELLEGNVRFSEKKSWIYGSIGFRFRARQMIELGYGETRGGMTCTNGLCRYVEPFKGFRLIATLNY